MLERIQAWDEAGVLFAARLRSPWLTRVLQAFTYTGTTRTWFGVGGALMILGRIGYPSILPDQLGFLRALFAPLAAWIVGAGIKRMTSRRRPFQRMGVAALAAAPKDESFPSSHTSSTVAFAVALACAHHPWAPWIGAWAAIVSFSRLYLGVHYPSDILGGAALGGICGVLAH